MRNTQSTPKGTLYIVATPIGNYEDITLRALEILQSVDYILAEDTRHSLPLLNRFGIKKHLISLHAFNENTKSDAIIALLLEGKSLALISDAGTPLISDPGYPLVTAALKEDILVTPIPGACALIAALSAAGIASETFTFGGFLPAKKEARCARLQAFNKEGNHTLIFYESTHRIKDSIEDIAAVFGADAEMVLAKELTKTFERFIKGTPFMILNWLSEQDAHCKGEFVVLIAPRPEADKTETLQDMLAVLLKEVPLKQAVKIATLLTKVNKNTVYKLAVEMRVKD